MPRHPEVLPLLKRHFHTLIGAFHTKCLAGSGKAVNFAQTNDSKTEEDIKDNMYMRTLKPILAAAAFALLFLPLLPLAAQERPDTVYTFRFLPADDMFYVPWGGNDKELARLETCVERLKERILAGEIPLLVDGYCTSKESEADNLATAKVRSNRVKSELIVRQGLTERCFVTRNHSGSGDYVTVRIAVPKEDSVAREAERRRAEQARLEAERKAEQERLAREREAAERERAEAERLATEQAAQAKEAQQPESPAVTVQEAPDRSGGWYVGLQGGVPFGVSAYSSFGADKTRAGWTAGVYGGYRFSPVLSLEVQAAWGQVNLSSRGCCPDYWLGSDGIRYEAAVAGMDGWAWNSLTSRTTTQRYGVQLNVNILGFFRSTRESRWTLEVSPLLAAYGTKAEFRAIDGGDAALKGGTRWHLGAGGNIQAGYDITRNLRLGIYTGVTYLTGQPLDGTPEHLHKANYIRESGLKLGWSFGKQGKEASK